MLSLGKAVVNLPSNVTFIRFPHTAPGRQPAIRSRYWSQPRGKSIFLLTYVYFNRALTMGRPRPGLRCAGPGLVQIFPKILKILPTCTSSFQFQDHVGDRGVGSAPDAGLSSVCI